MSAQGAAPEGGTSGSGYINSRDARSIALRPAEFRNEIAITILQLQMLCTEELSARTALWRRMLVRLRQRSPELIEQLERERLERVLR